MLHTKTAAVLCGRVIARGASRAMSTEVPSGNDDPISSPNARPVAQRFVETRGAMKDYMKTQGAQQHAQSNTPTDDGSPQPTKFWASLRDGLNPGGSTSQAYTDWQRRSGPATRGGKTATREPKQAHESGNEPSHSGGGGSFGMRSKTNRMGGVGDGLSVGENEEDDADRDRRLANMTFDEDRDDGVTPEELVGVEHLDEYFENLTRSGGGLDTDNMDPVDQFLAHLFLEANKTKCGQVRLVIDDGSINHARIPKPRPVRELMQSMVPNITTAPPNTIGHDMASMAWGVVSKNNHYSDADRDYICNTIASRANEANQFTLPDNEEADQIFDHQFRPGYFYMEHEKQVRAKMGMGTSDWMEDEETNTEDTDWDVEAVEDEDQL